MPFKSEAQRRFLWAKHPRIARRWADTYGTPKSLPKHVDNSGGAKAANSTEGAMTFEEKVIDAFQLSGAALDKAEKAAQDKAAQDKAVAELIPSVVDALVANGRIEPTEKDAALKALRDPLQTLKILTKTASHRNATEDSHLGQPVERDGQLSKNGRVKKASAVPGSEDSPFVGARTSLPKPSDLALFRGLGLDNLAQ